MQTVGVYLIFTAVLLRAAVVVSPEPEFPAVIALLAGYALLLTCETWLLHRKHSRFIQSPKSQLAYLILQSLLVIAVMIVASYEDFLALLFIPLSLDAVSFFGRRVGYAVIAILSIVMTLTLLFSDVGSLFGLVMGILYSGICFLFGSYTQQVRQARMARDQNVQMLSELQIVHRQLQSYADQKATLAVEYERNRLARELHDSVTQTVFSMNLAAQSAQLLFDKEPPHATGQLLHIEELAASALREIQSLVSQLRPQPLVEDGLPNALRRLALELKRQESLQVSLEIHGERTFSERIATGLYFIAHEGLINVSKHSDVPEALVRLNLGGDLACLEIEDHGRGFDPDSVLDQPGHLGLTSMVERAREIGWSLSVWSLPRRGTHILVQENAPRGLP